MKEWWIILVILFLIIAALIALIVVLNHVHNRGDHKDGGGRFISGGGKTSYYMSDQERAGFDGENLVNYHLRPLLRADEYLLSNVILRLKNGRSAEVDAIIISRKGIFCIEVKNWVGHISGKDDGDKWLQQYDDPEMPDRYHKNPVKQCLNECKVLYQLLNEKYYIEGAVIFADLEDGSGIRSAYTYDIYGFKSTFRKLAEDEISADELKQLYQKLCPFVATGKELERYKKQIKAHY